MSDFDHFRSCQSTLRHLRVDSKHRDGRKLTNKRFVDGPNSQMTGTQSEKKLQYLNAEDDE